MTKCYFVSDLHLFANRSNAHRYLEEIALAASQAEVFVLGGDIFDFRWSRIPILRAVRSGRPSGSANWPRPARSAISISCWATTITIRP